ncbi:MAG: hypothetical protein ACR5KX_02035 [Wolbachia sp.]
MRDMLSSVIGDTKIFEQKLAKLNSSTQENEKEKSAEELINFLNPWSQERLNLLLIEFSFVAEIKQNIEKL